MTNKKSGWFRQPIKHRDAALKGQRGKALARMRFLGHGGKVGLSTISQEQIKKSFLPAYQSKASEEEGLGIAIANHFHWNGLKIMKTFASALEDANFHTEAGMVKEWIRKIKE